MVEPTSVHELYPSTAPQLALADRAVEVLRRDTRVLAAWLDGSFGQGVGDPFSDVDVHVCVEDDALVGVEADARGLAEEILEPVWTLQIGKAAWGGFVLAVISHDWQHLDLAFTTRTAVAAREWKGTTPLFDRAGLLPNGPTPLDPPGEPWFPRELVEQFLYSVGNTHVVVGRDERILMSSSIGMLRDAFLIPLLHAERGLEPPKGGLKRLNQRLTDEEQALLLTMPPVDFDLEHLIDANCWLVTTFVRRARALSQRVPAAEYPHEFERATIDHIERVTGRRLGL